MLTDPEAASIAKIPVHPSESWHAFYTEIPVVIGTQALYLRFEGNGSLDLNTICFQ